MYKTNHVRLTTWKKSNGVKYHYLILKPSDTIPDPHGPLAESAFPSAIEEANEALTIASTANVGM